MDSSERSRGSYASINGADLYFETKGEGEAVVLLHAGVADSRMWHSQFEELSKTHFVIRCDLRGFGRSRMPAGAFAYHDDIASLLAYLDVEQATIVGVSFGGSVALDFALAYPQMVHALVLGSPALGGYEFTSPEILEFFAAETEALERGDVVGATELNLKMWVDGPHRTARDVNSDIRERVGEMQMLIFSQPEVEDVEPKELRPPAIDRLHELQVPTLVIVGEKDATEFQEISTFIAEHVTNAKHIVISDVAHLASMEKPEKFTRIVRDFLT